MVDRVAQSEDLGELSPVRPALRDLPPGFLEQGQSRVARIAVCGDGPEQARVEKRAAFLN